MNASKPAPVRYIPNADAIALPADSPAPSTESHSFFDALRAVTPALIITGIAIGVASGIGTTVGAALGGFLTDRFRASRKSRNSRKSKR